MTSEIEKIDFTISTLGEPKVPSPVSLSTQKGDYVADYVSDDQHILYDILTDDNKPYHNFARSELLEVAGPRKKLFFEPDNVHAGIVTCGGLCPGLNDVIRAIVMCLWYRYEVRQITGIRFGYRGFLTRFEIPVMEMTPDSVEDIHRKGGSILGSSRGYGELSDEIVDSLERMNINMLFTIGGDGTQRGALEISRKLRERGLKITLVGIPKTIDNDLSFVQRTFGFETAVCQAVDAVAGAHVEAHDAPNGIGIVKVMGRHSGYIATHTALALNDVNYVLIPEVPFELEGKNGLLTHLEKRLKDRNHAVILVAEGAGQDLLDASGDTDASGNKKLSDTGIFLKDQINTHFKEKQIEINLKYIDPSYIIRSAPANANDSIYCNRLGTNAVHAAMAGKTEMLISLIHDRLVHVPIRMAVSKRNSIDPDGALWRDVVEATGQPLLMKN